MSGEIISQELEVKQFFFKKLSGKSLMGKKISMDDDDVQVDTPISHRVRFNISTKRCTLLKCS